MTAYTVVNSTAVDLADGVANTPAYTTATGVTLTAAQIATILTVAGAAVLKDAPSAAVKNALAASLTQYTAGVAPSTSVSVAAGVAVTDFNAAGDDVAASGVALAKGVTAAELLALAGTAGVLVFKKSTSRAEDELLRKACKVLLDGGDPGARTTAQTT